MNNSDNLYKSLKHHSIKDGIVNRVYENEFVRLQCSKREIQMDENEEDDKWNCTFIHSGKIDEAVLAWDYMVNRFEKITLDKKLAEPELF